MLLYYKHCTYTNIQTPLVYFIHDATIESCTSTHSPVLTKRFTCPKGIHSIDQQHLYNYPNLSTAYELPPIASQLVGFKRRDTCCVPDMKALRLFEAVEKIISRIHCLANTSFEQNLEIVTSLCRFLNMAIVIPNTLDSECRRLLNALSYHCLHPMHSDWQHVSLGPCCQILEYSSSTECYEDPISHISLPRSCNSIGIAPSIKYSEVKSLSETLITLVYIDLHNKPAQWVTRFLQRIFGEGQYWTMGRTHHLLLPLIHLKNTVDFSILHPEYVHFSVAYTGTEVVAGQALVQHLLPTLYNISRQIIDACVRIPRFIDRTRNPAQLLKDTTNCLESAIAAFPLIITVCRKEQHELASFPKDMLRRIRVFQVICGKFIRPPTAPRETVENEAFSISSFDLSGNWLMSLCMLLRNFSRNCLLESEAILMCMQNFRRVLEGRSSCPAYASCE